ARRRLDPTLISPPSCSRIFKFFHAPSPPPPPRLHSPVKSLALHEKVSAKWSRSSTKLNFCRHVKTPVKPTKRRRSRKVPRRQR
ncbi:hypothetical protein ABVT39_008810, partial [Epinephelus coioides]